MALALADRDGLIGYPIENNVMSEDGTAYTGVVVQYEGDGIYDPHALYTQLDAVKHQYGCFLATHFATGTARVLAPRPRDGRVRLTSLRAAHRLGAFGVQSRQL